LARPRRHPEHVIGAGRTPARCRPAGGAVLTKPAPSGMPILPAAAQGGDGLEPIGIRAAGSAGARCTVTTSAAGPTGSHLRDRDLAVLGRGDSARGRSHAGRTRPPGNGHESCARYMRESPPPTARSASTNPPASPAPADRVSSQLLLGSVGSGPPARCRHAGREAHRQRGSSPEQAKHRPCPANLDAAGQPWGEPPPCRTEAGRAVAAAPDALVDHPVGVGLPSRMNHDRPGRGLGGDAGRHAAR
jgi:hypothetical protein